MITCPICYRPIARGDPNLCKLGESYFHNNCLRRIYKEALDKGLTLKFIWEDEVCIGVTFKKEAT